MRTSGVWPGGRGSRGLRRPSSPSGVLRPWTLPGRGGHGPLRHERFPIFPRQERVRIVRVDEFLFLGIDDEAAADAERLFLKLHALHREVLFRPAQRLARRGLHGPVAQTALERLTP